MYPVGDTLPVEELDPGTFLVAGPAMSGKYELLLDLAAEGLADGEGGLFVTTNQGAASVFDDIESRGVPPSGVRIVDCVSEDRGIEGVPEDRVEYVSSPGELTGLGIGFSEQLRRLAAADVARTRVCFHSVSTLLMYADLETVFRFLHVITGRVDGIDGLGLFAIDPTVHEEDAVNTLKQLFDGMIELRDGEDGPEIRLVGAGAGSGEWTARV